ncbi:20616_t:CDS:1, partial [Gigaspora rosea]
EVKVSSKLTTEYGRDDAVECAPGALHNTDDLQNNGRILSEAFR